MELSRTSIGLTKKVIPQNRLEEKILSEIIYLTIRSIDRARLENGLSKIIDRNNKIIGRADWLISEVISWNASIAKLTIPVIWKDRSFMAFLIDEHPTSIILYCSVIISHADRILVIWQMPEQVFGFFQNNIFPNTPRFVID